MTIPRMPPVSSQTTELYKTDIPKTKVSSPPAYATGSAGTSVLPTSETPIPGPGLDVVDRMIETVGEINTTSSETKELNAELKAANKELSKLQALLEAKQ